MCDFWTWNFYSLSEMGLLKFLSIQALIWFCPVISYRMPNRNPKEQSALECVDSNSQKFSQYNVCWGNFSKVCAGGCVQGTTTCRRPPSLQSSASELKVGLLPVSSPKSQNPTPAWGLEYCTTDSPWQLLYLESDHASAVIGQNQVSPTIKNSLREGGRKRKNSKWKNQSCVLVCLIFFLPSSS